MIGTKADTRSTVTLQPRANASMKVSKYTATGMTQRNGAAMRLADIWFVTANIRAEGTKAAASQKARVAAVGAARVSVSMSTREAGPVVFQTIAAAIAIAQTSAT